VSLRRFSLLLFLLLLSAAVVACTPRRGGSRGGGGGDDDDSAADDDDASDDDDMVMDDDDVSDDDDAAIPEWAPNGYPSILPENESYSGTGTGTDGGRMDAFNLVDQHGNMVDYRQFLGFVTLVDVAAEWCGPCRQAASEAEYVRQQIQAMGSAYYIQIVIEDVGGNQPTQAVASRWSNEFGLDRLPILADTNWQWAASWNITALPTFFLVFPDGTIAQRVEGAPAADDLINAAAQMLDIAGDDLREMSDWPNP